MSITKQDECAVAQIDVVQDIAFAQLAKSLLHLLEAGPVPGSGTSSPVARSRTTGRLSASGRTIPICSAFPALPVTCTSVERCGRSDIASNWIEYDNEALKFGSVSPVVAIRIWAVRCVLGNRVMNSHISGMTRPVRSVRRGDHETGGSLRLPLKIRPFDPIQSKREFVRLFIRLGERPIALVPDPGHFLQDLPVRPPPLPALARVLADTDQFHRPASRQNGFERKGSPSKWLIPDRTGLGIRANDCDLESSATLRSDDRFQGHLHGRDRNRFILAGNRLSMQAGSSQEGDLGGGLSGIVVVKDVALASRLRRTQEIVFVLDVGQHENLLTRQIEHRKILSVDVRHPHAAIGQNGQPRQDFIAPLLSCLSHRQQHSRENQHGEQADGTELGGFRQRAVEDVLDPAVRALLDSTTPIRRRLRAGRRAKASLATLTRVSGYCGAASPIATRTVSSTAFSRMRRIIAFASHSSGL